MGDLTGIGANAEAAANPSSPRAQEVKVEDYQLTMFQIIQEIIGGEDAVGVLLLWMGAAIPAHLSMALLLYPVKAKDVPDWLGWIVSLFVTNLGLVVTQRLVMKQMS